MKKGIRLIAFLLVLVGMILGAYRVYAWKDTSGDYLSSTQQLYHTPDHTIDVVFAGSSHCYCTIYPASLWERSGIAAFDAATSGQDKSTTYHLLVELCKTQSPKVVLVDMYGLLINRQAVEGNTYRNMLAMKTSKNSIELIKEFVEPEKQMDFFLKWPIVHTRFWEISKYDYLQYGPSTYGRGAIYQWGVNEPEIGEFETDKIGELSEKNLNWFDRICALGEKEGFELVFFVAPFFIEEEQQEVINAASQYAREKGIPFFDFNKMARELGIDYSKDFVESFHLNAYGAEKVTEYLRKYLLEHYDLPDRRGDPKYEAWDKDLTWYRHLEFKNILKNGGKIDETLEAASNLDQLCIMVDVQTNENPLSEEAIRYLKILGFSEDEMNEGGTWILQDGERKKVLEENGEVKEYYQDFNAYDSLRVRRSEERTVGDACINYEKLLAASCPVTVIIYDLFLQEGLPSIGF